MALRAPRECDARSRAPTTVAAERCIPLPRSRDFSTFLSMRLRFALTVQMVPGGPTSRTGRALPATAVSSRSVERQAAPRHRETHRRGRRAARSLGLELIESGPRHGEIRIRLRGVREPGLDHV